MLEETFHRAHKLLFASAISQLMVVENGTQPESPNLPPRTADGRVSDTVSTIVYVRLYALIIEVLLGIISILICVLWLYFQRRQTNLTSNPGCISQGMALIRPSDELVHEFQEYGLVSKRRIGERIRGRFFRLEQSHSTPKLAVLDGEPSDLPSCPGTAVDDFRAIHPWELSFAATVAGIVLLGGAVATITYPFTLTRKINDKRWFSSVLLPMMTTLGIPRPTGDT